MAAEFACDLFVIGAGSGGVRAARVAAQNGARVCIAEQSRVGGTCVIRGCVPKKLLVQAGDFRRAFENAPASGWRLRETRFDWASLRRAKDREIARLETRYRETLQGAGVHLIADRATIAATQQVRLQKTGKTVRAKYVLLAVGGRPSRPDIPGREQGVVSDDMFDLDALPESILIQGGGFIACEFASLLHEMGVQVTLLYRGECILRGFDADLRRFVQQALQARGVDVRTGAHLLRIETQGAARIAHLSNGETLTRAMVMHATGRVANTDGLGLETVGVALAENGSIPVDAWSRTSCEWLYAVGDATGRVALTPAAIREGRNVALSLFGGVPSRTNHGLVPMAVFTRPEIGTVGLSEEAARERGEVDVRSVCFRPLSAVMAGSDEQHFMKLVCEKSQGRVLGVHLAGPGSAEMIQLAAIAMEAGARGEHFARALPVHPTAAEELVIS